MADEKLAVNDLANPDLQLDVTREPWNLQYGVDGSVIIGRDVVAPGGIRPDGGRKNCGILLNTGTLDNPSGTEPLKLKYHNTSTNTEAKDERITSAFAVGWDARAAVYYTGRYENSQRYQNLRRFGNCVDFIMGETTWEYDHEGHSSGHSYVLKGVGTTTNDLLGNSTTTYYPQVDVGDYLHIKSVTVAGTTAESMYPDPAPFTVGAYKVIARSDAEFFGADAWIALDKSPSATATDFNTDHLHELRYTFSQKAGYFNEPFIHLATDVGSDPANYRKSEFLSDHKHLVKNGTLYADEGPWSEEVIGTTLSVNEGGRYARRADSPTADLKFTITDIRSTFNPNDTIIFEGVDGAGIPTHSGNGLIPGDRFHILYSELFNKTGIWISNGRKFWLVRDGYATEFHDMGSDEYLGEKWEGCRISNSRILWVNPKYPPQVIDLADSAGTSMKWGGITPPRCPEDTAEDDNIKDDLDVDNVSWRVDPISDPTAEMTVGGTETSRFRCKVRMVNLGLGLESDFVNVYDRAGSNDGKYTINIQVPNAGTAFIVGQEAQPTRDKPAHVPPIDPRWTHLEVWRTITTTGPIDGPDQFIGNGYEVKDLPTMPYYLETRVPLYPSRDTIPEPHEVTNPAISYTPDRGACELFDYRLNHAVIKLSNDDLQNLQIAATADHLGNGLPPVCQQAVSQLGVTICAGKSRVPRSTRTVYSKLHWFPPYDGGASSAERYDETATDKIKIINNSQSSFCLAKYSIRDSDKFIVLDWGNNKAQHDSYDLSGEWNIVEKLADERSLVLQDKSERPSVNGMVGDGKIYSVYGYVRRTHEIEYPVIDSDEEIWYSRTDKFSPESFPKRVLTLSSTGDVFRRIKPVGNYSCVLMASGVHLLYFEGNELRKDTVAMEGQGTPWPRSAAVFGPSMVWASADGPRILTVSNSPDQAGHRGVITPLDPDGKFRDWFRAAFDQGDDIDTGIDTNDDCIRFRRTPYRTIKAKPAVDETPAEPERIELDYAKSQVLQISMTTGLATFLEGDNGVCYVNTHVAEATHAESPKLYSVTAEGQLFETNYRETADAYEGMLAAGEHEGIDTTQDVVMTTTSISCPYSETSPMLQDIMVGDTVRFISDNANNGVERVITGFSLVDPDYNPESPDYMSGDEYYLISWDDALDNDPVVGDKFYIGGNVFKIRFAPFRGQSPRDIVTLDGVWIRALPGPRCGVGDWPDPPTGKLKLKAYRNYDDTPVAQESLVTDIPIYDDDDVSHTSNDRFVPLLADGTSIEIELECAAPRTDFRLESLEPVFRDSADERADLSTTE